MYPDAGLITTLLPATRAVPAPGVSTTAPTTCSGSGANGLNAPSSTRTACSPPSTPSGTVKSSTRASGSRLATTRASTCTASGSAPP